MRKYSIAGSKHPLPIEDFLLAIPADVACLFAKLVSRSRDAFTNKHGTVTFAREDELTAHKYMIRSPFKHCSVCRTARTMMLKRDGSSMLHASSSSVSSAVTRSLMYEVSKIISCFRQVCSASFKVVTVVVSLVPS